MNLQANVETGRLGEKLAEDYLKKQGYKIIDKNWHYSKNAEIDIIAVQKDVLVFVEVKTRKTTNFGHPFEAINRDKINKLHTAIYGYMSSKNLNYKNFRLDGIGIIGLENPKIEHIKNIGQF